MLVDTLPVGPIQTNCYLVTCPETHQALLIDPGWDDPAIHAAIASRQANVVAVVNTHAHWDHIGGNADLWQIPLPSSPEPARYLTPGAIIECGTLRFEVLFTPGHTPGHISLYEADHSAVFDGDVLFRQGIGRTD